MSVVIKVENVSKQYRLGLIGTKTLKGDLQRWWYTMRGLPDPTLIIGHENVLSSAHRTPHTAYHTPHTAYRTPHTAHPDDFVWALKDISFEVEQGEVLGIIGKNGAGKSTLLKLLSRVTAPTKGEIKVKGRIASLLEVGTGFHPELTGRENIFLNGAILGMTKTEIRSKFDEIVDFSGCELYIDTPVKRYSSGMYVRLAFAVAAHLEPEILIVDEVLAVGDAEFQKKAIGKMQDVSTKEGRTVLFVSHNMSAIISLTNKVLYLKNGKFEDYGNSSKIVNEYLVANNSKELIFNSYAKPSEPSLVKCLVHTSERNNIHHFNRDIQFEFHINMPYSMNGMCLSFQIFDRKERACFYNWIFDSERLICREKGTYKLVCKVRNFNLYKGLYTLTVHMADEKGKQIYRKVESICPFEVIMTDTHEWEWTDDVTVFLSESEWDVDKIS